ncbi:hypothetical protein BS17DRAFT_815136 [Gyrodon lividus]|nr:hypothetical protein BS17DRAFT_815136 [Gyrodon lividus]
MATQLNPNVASNQHNVDFWYWHMQLALAKPILHEDYSKFNHILMDRELMPAWAIVFKEGQDKAWLPYHLFSIMFHLQTAYDKGTKAALDIHAILPYDLVIESTKIFQKGYLMPDSKWIQEEGATQSLDNNANADDDNSNNNNGSDQGNNSEELPSTIHKGKAWATSPPQSNSSSMESEIAAMEDCTSQLSWQVQSQLADVHGWEVVTWEFEELVNSKELEWEEQFV